MLFDGTVDAGINGKFVAAGMYAQLQVMGQTELSDGILQNTDIRFELAVEAIDISHKVDPLVESSGKLWRNRLQRNVFAGKGCQDHQQLCGALGHIGLIHRHFGDKVLTALFAFNMPVYPAGFLYRQQVGFSSRADIFPGDRQGLRHSGDGQLPAQSLAGCHETLDVFCCCFLPGKIRHVDGKKIAGVDEQVDIGQVDVVGIHKIGAVPPKFFHGAVGFLAHAVRCGVNDLMLPMGFVPDHGYLETVFFPGLLNGCQLRFSLVGKAISGPDGVLVQSPHGFVPWLKR